MIIVKSCPYLEQEGDTGAYTVDRCIIFMDPIEINACDSNHENQKLASHENYMPNISLY